ncbi:uncharacterized protein BX663DRAFT_516694 [Cokeromyces recurvatus]|uniref:uncharacterized protein n=1 Tax=Cokeromyces recurvatus TaxID=90255 RepID=UPI00222116C1|nr:uncharacterized protein BX663DRAFT_516694 [Cokeromyces recurvatus]KAI7900839.1 hypothetical protein BX663DRAFT_516694 [Cokeromyces recurvatus]
MNDHYEILSSQIIQEEEDFFFDDDDENDNDDSISMTYPDEQQNNKDQVNDSKDDSFKRLLAGPSVNKAGLEGVDKDKVNSIIYEASKGSAFFEREKKRDMAVTKRINTILAKYELIKNHDLTFERNIVDNMIEDLETKTRDLTQCICHMDMDAFYASVEELENPELKKIPMAVGGMSMLCTSNYLARQYGVRSAMPGFIALKLCPQLKIIPLHFPKYRAASNKIRAVFEKYDPHYLPMSLDEAYLNLTEYLKTTELTPSELVEQIRHEIFEATQLTASAGIACNRMLAKVCSDINKPNGQYYLPMDRASIMSFVKDLHVRKIPGVGRVTERVLEALNVKTCGDIYPHRAILYKLLSPSSFQFMLKSYLGIGSTSVNNEVERKSVSVERTFSSMSDPIELFNKVKELSQLLEKDLEKLGYMGRNVGIKLKSVTYEVRIRSKTFPSYIWKAKDIERIAKELLIKELPVNIRLMGIRISTIKPRGNEDESVMKYFTKLTSQSDDNDQIKQQQSIEKSTNTTKLIHNKQYEQIGSNKNNTPHRMIEERSKMTLPALLMLPTSSFQICPICNCQIATEDNSELNQHIDICLSKVEVKAILKDQRKRLESSSKPNPQQTPKKRIKR